MTIPIKQSTTQSPLLFFMTDSADHIAGKTGLTPTVTISKAGAAFGAPAGAVTEIANGWYKVAGNATDTGTLGPIALHATSAGADPFDGLVAMVMAYDPQDAVRAGLTALPNAAAGANGGLPTGDAAGKVALQADQAVNTTKWAGTATTLTAGVPDVNVLRVAGTAQTANDLGAKLDVVVSTRLAPTTAGRTLDVTATGEAGIDWANIGSPTTVQGLSGTTVKRATDDYNIVANLQGALFSALGIAVGATGNDTTHVDLSGAGFGYVDDEINGQLIMITDTGGEIHSRWITDYVSASGLATLNLALPFTPTTSCSFYLSTLRRDVEGTLTSAYDFAKGTAAMTESYAANGTAMTPVQVLHAIHQMLMDFSISGTNLTVKKLDNATTAFIVTLNDATSPTAVART